MARRRSVGRAVAIGVTLVVIAAGVLAVRAARRTSAGLHPAHKPIRPEDRAALRAAVPTLAEVSFRTKDGLTLRGWYVPSSRRAAVILVHGGEDNRAHWLAEIRALAAKGYGVLAFDSRGSGESDGDLVTAGAREQADVIAALDFVSARSSLDVDPARIGVVGFSYGASSVALAAAKDPRAAAVVLQAMWSTLDDEMRRNNGKWGPIPVWAARWTCRREGLDLDLVRPIDHVAQIHPRRLLMIVGDRDEDTPPAIMERSFVAAAEPKEFWIVPGAHHGDYAAVAGDAYLARLVAFFDAALPW